MKYWTKNVFTGKICTGKAERWSDVSIQYGDRLYNPYTKTTVIGWSDYKLSLSKSQSKKYNKKPPFGTKIIDKKDRTIYKYPSGKTYVKHKTKTQIYGKAYDFRSDG